MVLMAITLAILTFVIGTTFDTSKDLNRAMRSSVERERNETIARG